VTEYDLHVGKRSQRPEVDFLSHGLSRVAGTCSDPGREIFDPVYRMVRKQQAAEVIYIQPLVGGPLDGPVIQIEAVDVDVGNGHAESTNAEAVPKGTASRPVPEETGGIYSEIKLPDRLLLVNISPSEIPLNS